MTEREKLIEAMAREDQKQHPIPWDDLSLFTQSIIKIEMRWHLAAIEAHNGGCVVVPKHPTRTMQSAGCNVIIRLAPTSEDTLHCNDVWKPMIASSPYAKEIIE